MKNSSPDSGVDLTQEKSLFSIYVAYRSSQRIPKFNIFITIFSLILISVGTFQSKSSLHDLRLAIIDLANVGIQTCATLLGFLVAGYTIFLTLVKPEHVKALSSICVTSTKLPYFKHVNFTFINVFIQYLIYFIFVTILRVFLIPHNGIEEIIRDNIGLYKVSIYCKTFIVIFALWSVVLALYLKSFIYNIYSSSMILFKLNYEELI